MPFENDPLWDAGRQHPVAPPPQVLSLYPYEGRYELYGPLRDQVRRLVSLPLPRLHASAGGGYMQRRLGAKLGWCGWLCCFFVLQIRPETRLQIIKIISYKNKASLIPSSMSPPARTHSCTTEPQRHNCFKVATHHGEGGGLD